MPETVLRSGTKFIRPGVPTKLEKTVCGFGSDVWMYMVDLRHDGLGCTG